ncbi:MAG: hypothetical protein DME87_00710 [Verrucomicrobia bacterium]|nr:MAG: hypothetical protein DME87_00710 [Verrucomicrobiota bacterium]
MLPSGGWNWGGITSRGGSGVGFRGSNSAGAAGVGQGLKLNGGQWSGVGAGVGEQVWARQSGLPRISASEQKQAAKARCVRLMCVRVWRTVEIRR